MELNKSESESYELLFSVLHSLETKLHVTNSPVVSNQPWKQDVFFSMKVQVPIQQAVRALPDSAGLLRCASCQELRYAKSQDAIKPIVDVCQNQVLRAAFFDIKNLVSHCNLQLTFFLPSFLHRHVLGFLDALALI